MAPAPPPPSPPPPLPDEIGFDAILDGLSNGASDGNKSAGLPSFAAESNGMDANGQLALVETPQQKPWEKPLTIPEIRKSSQNWSLASDAGLLLYLQDFSKKMMGKTSDLEKRMESLVHDAKSADSRVHNTFNDFLMLANTQFIENRVYDDSEDVDGGSQSDKDKKEQSTKSREQREAEVIPRVIKALTLGINVLDTGFEHLDANAGNSDSEDEDPTYKAVDPILEAKDMYGHRSLPYIIGTPAFMQDDDVGLMDLSEEEEEDDESSVETISDSEKSELSDSEYTDTETESEFTGGRQKMTADTTATSTNRSDSEESDTGLFDDDEPSDQEAAAQPMNFQDELSAKLGGGMQRGAPNQEPGETTDESNRNRSISEDSKASSQESSKKGTRRKKLPLDREKKSKKKRSTSKTEDDNLFSEQAGQDGEADDSPFGRKGLFSSSGGGLFDDDKEDDGGLFDEKPSAVRRDVTSDHVYEDIVANPEEVKPSRKAPPGGVPLFGAGVANEDELFGSSSKSSQDAQRSLVRNRGNCKRDTQKTLLLRACSAAMTRRGSAPEDAIAEDIGQKESSKQDDSSSGGLFDSQGDDKLFSESSKPAPKKETGKPKAKKQVDLFGGENDSDLFGENKPQQQPKKKIPAGAVNVFGNAGPVGGQTEPPPLDDGGDEGMYVNTMVGAAGAGRSKQAGLGGGGGLFDNVDEDLFGAPPPRPVEKPTIKVDGDKLFADDDDDNDLFAAPPPLPKDGTKTKPKKAAAKKNQGLFDDIEGEGEEDFFGGEAKPKEQPKKKPPGGVALFEGADIFGSPPKTEAEPPQKKPEQLSPQAKANRSQNTLSLFHDEEDKDENLFATPPALPPKKDQLDPNPSKEEQMSRRRTKSKSIFDDEAILFGLKNEENPGVDLFGSDTPVPQTKDQSETDEKSGTPRKRATSGSKGLFGEEDEGEDDLFASTASKTTSRSSGVKAAVASKKEKKKKQQPAVPPKGGLFDDDDEDDLFGESKPKKEKKKEEKKKEKKKEEKEEKKDAEKKVVEESSGAVDPLGGVGLAAQGAETDTPPEPPKEDPPSLAATRSSKKPPAGAVSMFGGMDPSKLTKKKKKEPEVDDDLAFESKASMNIDPKTLRPGAAPPERVVDSPAVGFDQPAVAKTLDVNPTKTRARISAKRRPPSRRSLQAAAASASNPALLSDNSKGADEVYQNIASDQPDLGASASAPAALAAASTAAPPPAKKPTSRMREDHMDGPPPLPPAAGVKPKKPTPSDDIFGDDPFSGMTNGSSSASSNRTVSNSKEERPFSIEGDSELFAAAAKKQPSRTHDNGDDLFNKPLKVDLDASIDDIFATPPVLGHSSKQSSLEADPTYEDIFASKANTNNKRSTLTDLAVDEDLFGDLGNKKSKDTSAVSIDEDLFSGPLSSSAAPATATTTKPKKKKSAKKTHVIEDDDDLFAEKPKKTKSKPVKATDDDLFGNSDIFSDLPASKPKEKKKKTTAHAQDAIFKDIGGDDIFAEPSPSSKPKKTKAKKKTTKEASDSIFDTDAPNIFDDPLNAMNN
ncbi:WASH complex subunit 2-like isoform X11 [Lytechinus variegatus]|uniref:WASH complex subunit 2-like isoform X11 n=1 Tax=Lytechinus variegatus TaxID=7654 RepID=UPI001BB20E79|nr:WASH complex subunit 2-like isoform X11 [Lytechinus variegatus]